MALVLLGKDAADIGEAGIEILSKFVGEGPHPSYRALSNVFGASGARRHINDVWQFLEDATTGAGGFANGDYLVPFARESSASGAATEKYAERQALADYDAFATHVCMASWDIIVAQEDSIKRECADDRISDFWRAADRRGADILEVMEQAWRQARLYGTGWAVVDAPDIEARTLADERMLGRARLPYVYVVKSKLVPYWTLDDDDELAAVVILEPQEDEKKEANIRVWTRTGWAVYARHGSEVSLLSSGPSAIGRVPVVPVHAIVPEGSNWIAPTDMLSVARKAQTIYNRGSEAREIERKAALTLSMPIKDVSYYDGKVIEIGVESILTYDGEAGKPEWISPDFESLNQFRTSTTDDKNSAFEAANLLGVMGSRAATTNSGMHAEIEMTKSERRVARDAASLEAADRRITGVALAYLGIDDPQSAGLSISYPRKFGIRDADRAVDRLAKLLAEPIGRAAKLAATRDTLELIFPRQPKDRIEDMMADAERDLDRTSGGGDSEEPASSRLSRAIAERVKRSTDLTEE